MGNILIVEDELAISNGLSTIIKDINKGINIDVTGYAEEALKLAKAAKYDVFLLDIQLRDYSGYELAKEIRSMSNYKLTPIVFITAIPTRELMAFKEIHCYDYIVKPFKEDTVKSTLKTIIDHGVIKEESYLKLKQKDYTYILKQDEIIYIESKNRKIFIVTSNEEIIISTYTLSRLLEELKTNFIQCHRGYIININYIEKIDKKKYDIYLKGIKIPIPVGRKYKEAIRSIIKWD